VLKEMKVAKLQFTHSKVLESSVTGMGKYHYHLVVLSDTCRREILTKINNRVLDEFISIKSIIEEEYRKANLSIEEKKITPLPIQIGTLILFLPSR